MAELAYPVLPTTRFARSPQFVYGDVDGEMVALHIENGAYIHLNQTASWILQSLAEAPASAADLVPPLCQKFAVTAERCEAEVIALLQQCAALGLLQPEQP